MGEQRTPWYFDCRMCGHVGRVEQLKDHPLRPVPDDFGFCPECMAPVEDPITRQQAIELFAEYGEDGLAEVSKLDAQVCTCGEVCGEDPRCVKHGRDTPWGRDDANTSLGSPTHD